MQRAVNAEVKADLRSSIMIQKANSRCFRSHCLFYNTFAKMQTEGLTAKESKPKESKSKELKLINGRSFALPHTNKSAKFTHQKKNYWTKKQNQKNSTSATKNNAIKNGEKKKGNKKCYNHLKKGHFTKNCPKLPKIWC